MIQPIAIQYNALINNIEQGLIKIPQFQRKFVWTVEETANLLDSILKGYPIGTFILWKTNERLRSIRDIGGINFPPTPSGDFVQYVLDGQQRMTSLYVSMRGVQIMDSDGGTTDYSKIYVDLEAELDEQVVITDISGRDLCEVIKFTDLLTGKFTQWTKNHPEYYWDKIQGYKDRFNGYPFSSIEVTEAPIDIATDIFTRINVGGKSLSVFEIMVAKTYDADRNFDLAEKYEDLVNRLENINYETIPDITVLQAVSVCMVKECSKKHILKLEKDAFVNIWDNVTDALERAVMFFHDSLRIPVSQLLPYDGLLVPFTYYFYHHKDKPVGRQSELLQDYFWRVVLNSRFSNALEAKIGQDIRRIDDILKDKQPTYDEPVDITPEYIRDHGRFATGTAYIKGLLCLLAYHEPKSFIDNAVVNINNSWLKKTNSKNYHHFFPKAYLNKHQVDDWKINHIANITIVDDFLNKRSIRDRAPSNYIVEYQKINSELEKTLETHLIGDPATWGILTDDYDLFFQKRLERYSEELKKRLLLTENDKY